MDLLKGSFEERLRKSISFAWGIFSERVGNDLLKINKEASMQLEYSSILKQLVPFICFEKDETVNIELETGAIINGKNLEIDLVVDGIKAHNHYRIAVEMKCYRNFSSSGNQRSATNDFKRNVYKDLNALEDYCTVGGFDRGVALVMNDLERLVNPKRKNGKGWIFDISQGARVENLIIPDEKKSDVVRLKKAYEFKWVQKGLFWFMEIEG